MNENGRSEKWKSIKYWNYLSETSTYICRETITVVFPAAAEHLADVKYNFAYD
jgi:hypothetical protein